MTTYEVTAKRSGSYWELHIAGVGVTQSRTLLSAEDMVREYIALDLDLDDSDGFDVRITPETALGKITDRPFDQRNV